MRTSSIYWGVLFFLSVAVSSAFFAPIPITAKMSNGATNTRSCVSHSRLSASEPAVLEPPSVQEKIKQEDEQATKQSSNSKRGGWAVRLFNDPMNKREFVAMCLAKVCGLSDGQAYQVMMQAHRNGVAVVGRYDFERAELYRDTLVGEGLVCDMVPVEDD